ncbi:hypothetical protein B23_0383 [Geobacillus thermoleovorans B23]|nr:hypothetical protein B23_0383 [Geobacillus thermoleovorans B23]
MRPVLFRGRRACHATLNLFSKRMKCFGCTPRSEKEEMLRMRRFTYA